MAFVTTAEIRAPLLHVRALRGHFPNDHKAGMHSGRSGPKATSALSWRVTEPHSSSGQWAGWLPREGLGGGIVGDAALRHLHCGAGIPRSHAPARWLGDGICVFHVHPAVCTGQGLLLGLQKAAWARAPTPGGSPALAWRWAGSVLGASRSRLHCAHRTVTLPVCLPEQPFMASPLKSRGKHSHGTYITRPGCEPAPTSAPH